MSTPDRSLIPPGPPPLEAPPHPIPERRRLRWWMVALGTILVAALVLGAGLALAAVLRDDGAPTASNRTPAVNLPGGLSGVGPNGPIDSIPDSIPGVTTSSTLAVITPGAQPTTPPAVTPTTAAAAPRPTSPPVTSRPPIGAGQIPQPTAPPRCSINSFVVDPSSVGVDGNGRLTKDVAISFNGNQICSNLMTVEITINNRPFKSNSQVRRQGSSYVWVLDQGSEVNNWRAGDYIVTVKDDNGQFKGSLPLNVFNDDSGVD